MADLELNIDAKLLEGISRLAIKHYGDDSEMSRQRVIETAVSMRLLWSSSVEKGQQETDEAVSTWEFPELTMKQENNGSIQNWLFRR